MDPITNINTNLFPELIQSDYPSVPVRQTSMAPVEPVKEETFGGDNQYDFNNYYDDVDFQDPLIRAGENFVQTANSLDKAMVTALENGFSINDACNIKLAQIAYKASATVFKSTFELKI